MGKCWSRGWGERRLDFIAKLSHGRAHSHVLSRRRRRRRLD
jgi:hypothetical protein